MGLLGNPHIDLLLGQCTIVVRLSGHEGVEVGGGGVPEPCGVTVVVAVVRWMSERHCPQRDRDCRQELQEAHSPFMSVENKSH